MDKSILREDLKLRTGDIIPIWKALLGLMSQIRKPEKMVVEKREESGDDITGETEYISFL